MKGKKSTINPKYNDDNCFQYAITVALNPEQIQKDPQRITKIKPCIDKYNWKEIRFPSHQKDWKNFQSNNKAIILILIFYMFLAILKK